MRAHCAGSARSTNSEVSNGRATAPCVRANPTLYAHSGRPALGPSRSAQALSSRHCHDSRRLLPLDRRGCIPAGRLPATGRHDEGTRVDGHRLQRECSGTGHLSQLTRTLVAPQSGSSHTPLTTPRTLTLVMLWVL